MCITNDDVSESMSLKEIEKKEAEQAMKTKQLEREQKRKDKEKEKREKKERKKAKAIKRKRKMQETAGKDQTVEDLFARMQISDEELSDDDTVCPKCGLMYSADNGVWICRNGCESWYDLLYLTNRHRLIFGTLSQNTIMGE